MILHATNTHLYPGHRGKISGAAQIAGLETGRDCLVEFPDGSAAAATIKRSANGWRLETNPYRTTAGTDIAAKCWSIDLQENDGQVEFRILEKLESNLAHAYRHRQ